MNGWLRLAAGATLFVGLAHSYLGERYVLVRLLRRADLPHLLGSDVFTKQTLRFAWHLTSVSWWGAAAVLLALGQNSLRLGVLALSLTFFTSALVTLVASRGRHLAWPVFLLIAVAAWLGAPPAGG